MVRVLVVGNSAAHMVVPPLPDRTQGAYGDHLEAALRRRGVDAVVETRSRWYDLLPECERRFVHEVSPDRPDVVVLQYGSAECQPNVLPTALNRHFTTWDQGVAGWRGAYRRHVAPSLWRAARRYQRRAAAAAGPDRSHRVSPARFVAGLTGLIRMTRLWGGQVVLAGIPAPNDALRFHLPGIDERMARYDALLREVAAREGAGYVPVPPAGPDGLHLTADGHRLVGERLADAIVALLHDDAVDAPVGDEAPHQQPAAVGGHDVG